MGTYPILLGGIILAVVLLVILRSVRTKVSAHQVQVAKQDLTQRIRELPPPTIKVVKEPDLKLPRRNAGDGSSKPWAPK